MTKTPNLSFYLIQPNQAQKELTANEALVMLDGMLNNCLKGTKISKLPDAPGAGDLYHIDKHATTQAGMMALYTEGGWRYFTPKNGLTLWRIEPRGLVTYVDGEWHQSNS